MNGGNYNSLIRVLCKPVCKMKGAKARVSCVRSVLHLKRSFWNSFCRGLSALHVCLVPTLTMNVHCTSVFCLNRNRVAISFELTIPNENLFY